MCPLSPSQQCHSQIRIYHPRSTDTIEDFGDSHGPIYFISLKGPIINKLGNNLPQKQHDQPKFKKRPKYVFRMYPNIVVLI